MNKQQFIDYWRQQEQDVGESTYRGSFDWLQFEITNNCTSKVMGYDEIVVTAKFQGGDLIEVAYDSHVAYCTNLFKQHRKLHKMEDV